MVEVPRQTAPPPGLDDDPDRTLQLPDPDELHLLEALQLTASLDEAPVLPRDAGRATWTMLPTDELLPF